MTEPIYTAVATSPDFVGDYITSFACCGRVARLFAEAGKFKWSRHCSPCGKLFDVELFDGRLQWTERRR